jgi:hypothetical protein
VTDRAEIEKAYRKLSKKQGRAHPKNVEPGRRVVHPLLLCLSGGLLISEKGTNSDLGELDLWLN